LEQKFDLFDLNGDGFLTRKELAEGLHSIGTPGVTPEKIDKIFAYYDTNKDGRISLREAQRGNEAGPDELLKMFGAE
jgi:Ca2+-binding EF-hand superfamily protein